MIANEKLLLKGRRFRRFHEFTFVSVLICTVFAFISIRNSLPVGIFNSELLPFIIGPILFIIVWIPLKNSELKLKKVLTDLNKTENQELLIRALSNLNYQVTLNNKGYVEATAESRIGITWGRDHIFAVIDNRNLYLTSLTNLDSARTQAFFTFGKLKRNVGRLIQEIEKLRGA